MATTVTAVLKNVARTTGEGPHWDSKTKCLLFVDINQGGIHRWYPSEGVKESVEFPDKTVSFVVPKEKHPGVYLIGLDRTISDYDWGSRTLTKMFETELKGTKNRFNDGKCDPSGRLWAGTMGTEQSRGRPEPELGCLFSMDPDGKVKTRLEKINISNGLAWTSDNKTMYYIDSTPRKVYAFDYDIDTGDIANQRTAVDFSSSPIEDLGFPDGMTIDADGKLWIACYLGGKVVCFDPNTGKRLQTVAIPAPRTTSCCFGGENMDELYVTCGSGESDEERAKYPLGGSIFRVTGLGVKGTPCVDYKGN